MLSNFTKIIDMLYAKSPLQKKKLEKYLARKNEAFFSDAEQFTTHYLNYLESQNIPLEYVVDAYLGMCKNMMKCQISFMKTGQYSVDQSSDAFDNVYNNKTQMQSYMIGLAISQFLWSTHYEMYSFLKGTLKKLSEEIGSYLEIGPGHGLFLNKAMEYLGDKAKLTVVDISPTSIEITKSIMHYFYPKDFSKINFHTIDMLKLDLCETYDFITMGEVLEHVNFPDKLLEKMRDLLSVNGKAFVSTCVNCPAIDHVYHFKSIEEIRVMFSSCGLRIIEECVLPVEELPLDEIIRRKITINYCALLQKA